VPTDRAAREIVSALHKRRFEAVITGHAKLAAFANRHFPGLFRRLVMAYRQTRQQGGQ
jgi:hypothetical protein